MTFRFNTGLGSLFDYRKRLIEDHEYMTRKIAALEDDIALVDREIDRLLEREVPEGDLDLNG